MKSADHIHETRLTIRLQGPLAEHADRQVESALYKSHNEYIRDLIRRDMASRGRDQELEESILRGMAEIKEGKYERWEKDTFLKDRLNKVRARRSQR